MPTVLLFLVCFIRLWKFTETLGGRKKPLVWGIKICIKICNDAHHTFTSFRYINFHPQRWARTAMSMSSTVVRSNQPPQSSRALILHTPAVPLKPKKLINTPLTCCSTSKWNDKFMFCNLVSKFSSLFTKAHLVWTRARSSFPWRND